MKSVHKNVIIDLLPAYLAGEASEESKVLVEEFAKTDPDIAKMIQSGKIESELIPDKMDPPSDLEKKTITRIRQNMRMKIWYLGFATAVILAAPLVAMQLTNEVNWGLLDFIIGGTLIFSAGFTFIMITNISSNWLYRIGFGAAIAAILLLIWTNLAVGIIGSEENSVNLLYLAVIAVSFIGARISRFKSRGMAVTMLAAAAVQLLIPVIVFIVWGSTLDEQVNLTTLLVINVFFAALFFLSAVLFKSAEKKNLPK